MGLTFSAKPRRRNGLRVLIAIVVLILIAAGAIFLLVHTPGPPGLPKSEVDAYLNAWGKGDTRTMESLLDKRPADLATTATSLVKSAPGSHATYTRTGLVRDKKGEGATATYSARVDVGGFGPVEWKGTLHIARVKTSNGTQWEINWNPSNLYPGLAEGQHLTLNRVWATRAPIIAADGSFLAGSQAIVKIGLEPDRITKSLPKIKRLMQSLVGTQPTDIDAALHGPGVQPNYFVEIATVPDDALQGRVAAEARADPRRVLPTRSGRGDAGRVGERGPHRQRRRDHRRTLEGARRAVPRRRHRRPRRVAVDVRDPPRRTPDRHGRDRGGHEDREDGEDVRRARASRSR